MSDDTHAPLAGPSRPTCDVVLTGSYDSMGRTQALRRASVEYVEVGEIPGVTKMETVGEGSRECYLARRRRLRPTSVPSQGFESCVLVHFDLHSVLEHHAFVFAT